MKISGFVDFAISEFASNAQRFVYFVYLPPPLRLPLLGNFIASCNANLDQCDDDGITACIMGDFNMMNTNCKTVDTRSPGQLPGFSKVFN